MGRLSLSETLVMHRRARGAGDAGPGRVQPPESPRGGPSGAVQARRGFGGPAALLLSCLVSSGSVDCRASLGLSLGPCTPTRQRCPQTRQLPGPVLGASQRGSRSQAPWLAGLWGS